MSSGWADQICIPRSSPGWRASYERCPEMPCTPHPRGPGGRTVRHWLAETLPTDSYWRKKTKPLKLAMIHFILDSNSKFGTRCFILVIWENYFFPIFLFTDARYTYMNIYKWLMFDSIILVFRQRLQLLFPL